MTPTNPDPVQPEAPATAVGIPKSFPPKKRTGPGNPGKVATHAEISERIDVAIALLIKGYRFNTVVRKLSDSYGISRRMSAIYISHAKEAMLRDTGRSREELVAEAYSTYASVKKRADAGPADIISAQKAIADLLGLDAPKRHKFDGDLRVRPVLEIKHAHERDAIETSPDDLPATLALGADTDRSV